MENFIVSGIHCRADTFLATAKAVKKYNKYCAGLSAEGIVECMRRTLASYANRESSLAGYVATVGYMV
jgi:hypothetical protein